MNEKLSQQIKNKINNICRIEIYLCEILKKLEIFLPPIFLSIFVFLYFEIRHVSLLAYIAVALVISIVVIISIKNITCPFDKIAKDECTCFESVVLGNRIGIQRDENGTLQSYYVTTKIDNESKEIAYKGKSFENLSIGEKILVISYRNLWGKEKFICFLEKEINE